MEGPYVRNRFHIVVAGDSHRLRCHYCESDIDRFVVASRKGKWFSTDPGLLSRLSPQKLKDIVFFENERDAHDNGYHSKRAAAA
jgi:hypothetical protein